MAEDTLLRTKELMRRLGYTDRRAVLRLFRKVWNVKGGTRMLPGRGKSGYEYAVPALFFEKWLQSREVSA